MARKVSGQIASIGDLLKVVLELSRRTPDLPLWYRGLTRVDYDLVPSIGRPPYSIESEPALINTFKQNALPFVERRPTTEWEWLFLMRHHDVPTRLLDWTESPPAALFFAVNSLKSATKNESHDGAFWILYPTRLNEDAGIKLTRAADLPIFEPEDKYMRNYMPSVLAQEAMTRLKPAAGLAIRQSRRMERQHSVFTVTHRDQVSVEGRKSSHLLKYIVPSSEKQRIRGELHALRFTRLSLFPDLDNVGRATRDPSDA